MAAVALMSACSTGTHMSSLASTSQRPSIAVSVGSPVTVPLDGDHVTVTVRRAFTATRRDDGSVEASGVDVSVTNLGPRPLNLEVEDFYIANPDTPTSWTHSDDDGTWGPDPVVYEGAYTVKPPPLTGGTLQPKASIRGTLLFSVATGPELLYFAPLEETPLAEWQLHFPVSQD